jgi:hypothetical protein
MAANPPIHASGRAAAVAPDSAVGYVDWPAILAGAVLASAIAFVLLTFGSAIGLSAISAEPGEGASLLWIGIASGIWFVWVAVSSFAAGGYLAGRLRRPFAGADPDEVETRDGAHGVMVWATGALLGAVMAASGVSGLVGSVGAAAGNVADVATEAVSDSVGAIAGRLVRGDPSAEADTGAAREEVVTAVTRSLRDGELAEGDRSYLIELAAARTGQSPEEAAASVDAAVAQAQALYDDAIDAAERARTAGAIAAFVVAASLFVAAAAAYFAATVGGDHRDRALPFRSFGR